ncbi:MAG: hypothetical protein BV458_13040 [Thermoplasmata archaeon M9B2D]|nr:MAG: hypothetical protein BV458_13040 [Thermoplasmata archaeon M9B2D]
MKHKWHTFIIMTLPMVLLQGCIHTVVTEYDNCVPNMTLEVPPDLPIYFLDDRNAKNSPSSTLEDGKYYLSIGKDAEYDIKHSQYYEGWKVIKVKTDTVKLTGRMKKSSPKMLKSMFVDECVSLEAILDGQIVWITPLKLKHKFASIDSNKEKIEIIFSATPKKFPAAIHYICPNPEVKEADWHISWRY